MTNQSTGSPQLTTRRIVAVPCGHAVSTRFIDGQRAEPGTICLSCRQPVTGYQAVARPQAQPRERPFTRKLVDRNREWRQENARWKKCCIVLSIAAAVLIVLNVGLVLHLRAICAP